MIIKNPLELLTEDPAELSVLTLKSNLMILIVSLIRKNEWSKEKASEELKVSQSQIDYLMNGQIREMSIEELLKMICSLDYKINIDFDKISKSPLSLNVKKVDC